MILTSKNREKGVLLTIDNQDFKTFFEVAFDIKDVNELKCFKCGKSLEELSDKTGLTCSNSHTIGYLEYMTMYANMLKDFFDNGEISRNFSVKVIEPSNIMYCDNSVLFINENIVRS